MTLLLLPNLLGPCEDWNAFLPQSVPQAVATLDGLIAESPHTARLYLQKFKLKLPPHQIPIAGVDGKTPYKDLDFYLEPILKGETWGYLSDAGLPCIADPGAAIVWRAHRLGIPIQAFVGPSALMMALMLSGLNGQSFAFRGYPPKDEQGRVQEIERLQREVINHKQTQIFIEAPYRNEAFLASLLQVLDPDIALTVAWDLTLPTQGVISNKVRYWKKNNLSPSIRKRPTMFLFGKAYA